MFQFYPTNYLVIIAFTVRDHLNIMDVRWDVETTLCHQGILTFFRQTYCSKIPRSPIKKTQTHKDIRDLNRNI